MKDSPAQDPLFDSSVAHPARRYNYWLGGKDNFAADRASGDALEKAFPAARTAALENRAFLHRVVGWLARENNVTQFLDIGTGLPLSPNTHDTAQSVVPEARVVYVDNDLLVLSHARALMRGLPSGKTAYVNADATRPSAILTDKQLLDTLDLSRPVAVLLIAVLHFIDDDATVRGILAELVDSLAPGSFVVITHHTRDPLPTELRDQLAAELAKPRAHHGALHARSRRDLAAIYDGLGLELVEPGLVSTIHWHPELEPAPRAEVTEAETIAYACVARRP